MIFDRLANLVTGLGTVKDKTYGAAYTLTPLDATQLAFAYRGDWLARKIVDVPAFDAVRAWRDWQAEDEHIEAIEAAERVFQIRSKLARALKMARLYGGAALILGVDGDPATPIEIDRVQKGGLKYVHAVSRHELSVQEQDRDLYSPYFGEPREYLLNTAGADKTQVRIHPSRVVRLIGADPLDINRSFDGWGDSVLQAVDDAVKDAGLTTGGIASLIQEAKVDVYKIKGLTQNVGDKDYRERIIERFKLANTAKSLVNGLLLDAEEEYEQKTINFSQLPELARLYLMVAAGAADIPATRLLGQSPDGMNSTGESDIRNYYDRISADQELTLRPALERLDEVLIRSALGSRPPEVHYTFSPLWQISAKERAEIFRAKAEGARAIAGSGGASSPLMPIEALSDALVNAFVEDGSLPGLEAAIDEYGKLSEQEQPDETERAAAMGLEGEGRATQDAAPRTLYVSRKLLNADEFIAWARAQGFETTLPADDLHVTIASSRAPVDWMAMGENWSGDGKGNLTVQAGGPRLVEPLGDKGAVVLLFSSTELQWRHMSMREKGASWDFPEYQPHVSITYQGSGLDLSKVEPYRGALVFGPEIFAEVDDDWSSKVTET